MVLSGFHNEILFVGQERKESKYYMCTVQVVHKAQSSTLISGRLYLTLIAVEQKLFVFIFNLNALDTENVIIK